MDNYVGKRIDGRYEILEIIGVGGMAVVYKAYDNVDSRTVAVKVLKNEFSDDQDTLRRFRNESKAISSLDHQNIVKIYDVSFGNLIQYIVMEYVEGITLKEYIQQQGILNKNEALYYITQILRALQHAHDKGIIHRDIKPQNIMLMSNGTIKVTDFGIARISRSETKTMSTDAVGSIHYISPEQIKGGVTDAKSDIYSVGIVLYEMLTGKLPFDASNTAQVIFMQIESEPELPSKINPSILPGLEQIIIRAMQKNKSFRYQSSTEMLIDIETITRNPEARFNYSHFVDKQPTQKISSASEVYRQAQRPVTPRPTQPQRPAQPATSTQQPQRPAQPTRPTQPQRPSQPRRSQDPRYRAEMKQQLEKEKKSTKKIVISLVVVLVLLIGVATGLYFYFDKDTNRVVVPNFVGKNYSREILNNPDYETFTFEIINEENSNIDEGQVLSQNPTGGKVDRGSTIVLHIAVSNEKLTVPDVYNQDFASAEYMLKTSGFIVKILRQPSSTVDEGKVIRTTPAKGEEVSEGATITMYVCSGEAVEKVAVPDLMGMTIEEAKAELEKYGLSIDSRHVEYRPSSMERGKIFGYDHRGEEVEVGSQIAVYISKGNETTAPSTTESTTVSTTASTTVSTTASTAPSTTAPSTTASTAPSTTAPSTTASTTAPTTADDDTPVLDD